MNKIESWKILLSPILLIYSCFLFLIASPPIPLTASLVPLLMPVYDCLGLSHSWELFAPDLDKANAQIYAFITFADGQTIMESLPADEPFPERALHFKLRQWFHDLVPRAGAIWPDTAKYVARLHMSDKNPPVLVSLVCHWALIELPPPAADSKTKKTGSFTFYTRAFRPEELR